MNAMDVMVRAVITIKPDDTVAKAVDLFAKHDISALPVVDDNDTVVGIISEADLVHREEIGTPKFSGRGGLKRSRRLPLWPRNLLSHMAAVSMRSWRTMSSLLRKIRRWLRSRHFLNDIALSACQSYVMESS